MERAQKRHALAAAEAKPVSTFVRDAPAQSQNDDFSIMERVDGSPINARQSEISEMPVERDPGEDLATEQEVAALREETDRIRYSARRQAEWRTGKMMKRPVKKESSVVGLKAGSTAPLPTFDSPSTAGKKGSKPDRKEQEGMTSLNLARNSLREDLKVKAKEKKEEPSIVPEPPSTGFSLFHKKKKDGATAPSSLPKWEGGYVKRATGIDKSVGKQRANLLKGLSTGIDLQAGRQRQRLLEESGGLAGKSGRRTARLPQGLDEIPDADSDLESESDDDSLYAHDDDDLYEEQVRAQQKEAEHEAATIALPAQPEGRRGSIPWAKRNEAAITSEQDARIAASTQQVRNQRRGYAQDLAGVGAKVRSDLAKKDAREGIPAVRPGPGVDWTSMDGIAERVSHQDAAQSLARDAPVSPFAPGLAEETENTLNEDESRRARGFRYSVKTSRSGEQVPVRRPLPKDDAYAERFEGALGPTQMLEMSDLEGLIQKRRADVRDPGGRFGDNFMPRPRYAGQGNFRSLDTTRYQYQRSPDGPVWDVTSPEPLLDWERATQQRSAEIAAREQEKEGHDAYIAKREGEKGIGRWWNNLKRSFSKTFGGRTRKLRDARNASSRLSDEIGQRRMAQDYGDAGFGARRNGVRPEPQYPTKADVRQGIERDPQAMLKLQPTSQTTDQFTDRRAMLDEFYNQAEQEKGTILSGSPEIIKDLNAQDPKPESPREPKKPEAEVANEGASVQELLQMNDRNDRRQKEYQQQLKQFQEDSASFPERMKKYDDDRANGLLPKPGLADVYARQERSMGEVGYGSAKVDLPRPERLDPRDPTRVLEGPNWHQQMKKEGLRRAGRQLEGEFAEPKVPRMRAAYDDEQPSWGLGDDTFAEADALSKRVSNEQMLVSASGKELPKTVEALEKRQQGVTGVMNRLASRHGAKQSAERVTRADFAGIDDARKLKLQEAEDARREEFKTEKDEFKARMRRATGDPVGQAQPESAKDHDFSDELLQRRAQAQRDAELLQLAKARQDESLVASGTLLEGVGNIDDFADFDDYFAAEGGQGERNNKREQAEKLARTESEIQEQQARQAEERRQAEEARLAEAAEGTEVKLPGGLASVSDEGFYNGDQSDDKHKSQMMAKALHYQDKGQLKEAVKNGENITTSKYNDAVDAIEVLNRLKGDEQIPQALTKAQQLDHAWNLARSNIDDEALRRQGEGWAGRLGRAQGSRNEVTKDQALAFAEEHGYDQSDKGRQKQVREQMRSYMKLREAGERSGLVSRPQAKKNRAPGFLPGEDRERLTKFLRSKKIFGKLEDPNADALDAYSMSQADFVRARLQSPDQQPVDEREELPKDEAQTVVNNKPQQPKLTAESLNAGQRRVFEGIADRMRMLEEEGRAPGLDKDETGRFKPKKNWEAEVLERVSQLGLPESGFEQGDIDIQVQSISTNVADFHPDLINAGFEKVSGMFSGLGGRLSTYGNLMRRNARQTQSLLRDEEPDEPGIEEAVEEPQVLPAGAALAHPRPLIEEEEPQVLSAAQEQAPAPLLNAEPGQRDQVAPAQKKSGGFFGIFKKKAKEGGVINIAAPASAAVLQPASQPQVQMPRPQIQSGDPAMPSHLENERVKLNAQQAQLAEQVALLSQQKSEKADKNMIAQTKTRVEDLKKTIKDTQKRIAEFQKKIEANNKKRAKLSKYND
ncbi:MAG: hypothetical protein ACOYLU_02725 [Limisphaerales bacterium]